MPALEPLGQPTRLRETPNGDCPRGARPRRVGSLTPRDQCEGTPSIPVLEHDIHFLEIVTPDVEAVCRLYGEAYGWQFEDAKPELGNAFVATLPGDSLCSIRAPRHEQETPIVRTYVRVADIEAAVKTAAELGAEILLELMEIPGHGKIAIYRHGGIDQGIWEIA